MPIQFHVQSSLSVQNPLFFFDFKTFCTFQDNVCNRQCITNKDHRSQDTPDYCPNHNLKRKYYDKNFTIIVEYIAKKVLKML